jgi:hypothetical protein
LSLPRPQRDVHIETIGPVRPGESTPARVTVGDHPPKVIGLVFDSSAPKCRLEMHGVIAAQTPDERPRPYLELPQLGFSVEVRVAFAFLPNGLAAAQACWLVTGEQCQIHLSPGGWREGDLKKTAAALRWLETLPRLGGRPADPEEEALEEMVGWAREYIRRHPDTKPADIGHPELIEVSGMSPRGLSGRMHSKNITLKKIRARIQGF